MRSQYVRRTNKSGQKDADNWILQRTAVRSLPAKTVTPKTQSPAGDRPGIKLDLMQIPLSDRSAMPVQAKQAIGQQDDSFSVPIQAKLRIGSVDDKYEREADRIAAEVTSKLEGPSSETAQRKPEPSPLKEKATGAVSTELEASIKQAKGKGNPLAKTVREPMERALGNDLSGVRIHADRQSDKINQSLQARAFTTGKDIFFQQGEYSPDSSRGRELINHELVHVAQQRGEVSQQNNSGGQIIQRKDKKGTEAQGTADSGTNKTDMWRIPAPKVKKGKAGAVIQDNGEPSKAIAGSNGDYLFSEKGAGVKPLALIGTKKTILDFLKSKSKKGITNQNKTLPDINMAVSYYQPSERFQGLFPAQDTIKQLTEKVSGIAGDAGLVGGWNTGAEAIGEAANSGALKDIGAAAAEIAEKTIGDVVPNSKSKNVKAKLGEILSKKPKESGGSLICVLFHYLPVEGATKVGKGRVGFNDILPAVEKRLSAFAG
ncbi:MAG: DUF4157 domain-containing protein [Hormoscilla sp.]